MVSILGEHNPYTFPEGFDNGIRLKDILEDEVDEKFYISDEKCEKLISQINKGKGMNAIEEPSGIYMHDSLRFSKDALVGTSRCLKATKHDSAVVMVKEATKQGFAIAHEYDSINLEQPNSQTRRGRVGRQIANTLTCGCNQAVVEPNIQNYRIRKLTPLECWRLMGFDDEHFYKAQDAGISNSQLYKQAGNSIVVDVLEHIFINLFK